MGYTETRPSAFDDAGHPFKRRMSDERLQNVANSAILKILQYVITAIALPLIGWSLSAVLERITAVERAVNKADTSTAVYELRLQNLERAAAENTANQRLITEKLISHDFELKVLKRP